MRGGLLCGCGSQTSFLNHGRHRPSSVKQLYPPVPLSSTCIWLKYSAWLPVLPCMYNYRICCLPLITLPNNVWRGRQRWIPNEVWKRLIKIAMVKSQRTSVCSALADQGRWEDRLCAWDSKLFLIFFFCLEFLVSILVSHTLEFWLFEIVVIIISFKKRHLLQSLSSCNQLFILILGLWWII